VGAYVHDEDDDAKQRDPDRDGIGPGVETSPPSFVSLLRLGQSIGFLLIANCDLP